MFYLDHHLHLTELNGARDDVFCKQCNKIFRKKDLYAFVKIKGLYYLRKDRAILLPKERKKSYMRWYYLTTLKKRRADQKILLTRNEIL